MAQPVPFLFVAALLTVGLLFTARQSEQLLESDDGTVTVPERQHSESVPTESPNRSPPAVGASEQRPAGQAADGNAVPAEPTDLAPAGHPTPRSQPQAIELTPAVVVANVAVTQGLIAAIVLGAGWYFGIPADAFGVTGESLSTGLPAVGVGVGFGVLLWLGNELSTTIADSVGAAYDEAVRELLAPDSSGGWVVLFGLVLPIIAVAEELLFRAALIGVPATFFEVSPWLLAVLASVAFALGHGAQGRVGIVVTGLLGFVLAAGYILSESLLVVVVAHYVINALEFFIHEYLGIETSTIATPG